MSRTNSSKGTDINMWIMGLIFCTCLAGISLSGSVKKLPIQTITLGNKSNILCPHWGWDGTFTLFKDGEKVVSSALQRNETDTELNHTDESVLLWVNAEGQAYFTVAHVNVNSTGLYACSVQTLPSVASKKLPEELVNFTVVFVIGITADVDCVDPTGPECPPEKQKNWVWMVSCGVLVIYSLVITPVTIKIWHKYKSKDSKHDYINMKPRGYNVHKGSQNPNRRANIVRTIEQNS